MSSEQLMTEFIEIYQNIFKYMEILVSQSTEKYKISFEQFVILTQINDEPNRWTLTDLANLRGVTKGAIARQVSQLRKMKYIIQSRGELDHRRVFLNTSEAGRQVAVELSQVTSKHFNQWIDMFGREDAELLLKLMNRFGKMILEPQLKNKYVAKNKKF